METGILLFCNYTHTQTLTHMHTPLHPKLYDFRQSVMILYCIHVFPFLSLFVRLLLLEAKHKSSFCETSPDATNQKLLPFPNFLQLLLSWLLVESVFQLTFPESLPINQ